jgi:hypothetical protein
LPQTTWGSFVALQRGQTLRAGAVTVQFEALRLRLLDFEVFFFGTAIVSVGGRVGVDGICGGEPAGPRPPCGVGAPVCPSRAGGRL